MSLSLCTTHRLLKSEAKIIKLSSSDVTNSCISCPFNNSSPRDLNGEKVKFCPPHSATNMFNFASISFSFVAEMQTSCQQSKAFNVLITICNSCNSIECQNFKCLNMVMPHQHSQFPLIHTSISHASYS